MMPSVPRKLFTGTFTLNDTKVKGVKDVIIIVIDEKNRKYTLTTLGPTKTECISGGGVQLEYDFFSSEARIISPGKGGGPRFGEPDENGEWVDEEGCVWYLNLVRNDAGDIVEASWECVGSEPPVPTCPRLHEVYPIK